MRSEKFMLHALFKKNNPAAIEAGLVDAFSGLSYEKKMELLEQKNENLMVPLHVLFLNRNPAAIKAGLKAFSGLSSENKMALLRHEDSRGYTPLYVLFRNNPAAIRAGLEIIGNLPQKSIQQLIQQLFSENQKFHIARFVLELNDLFNNKIFERNLTEHLKKIIKFTVDERRQLFNQQFANNSSILHFLFRYGTPEAIKAGLDAFSGLSNENKMALLRALLSKKDYFGYTPLHVLFRNNNPAAITAGLEAFSGLSNKEKMALLRENDIYGFTPLHVLFCFDNPTAIEAGLKFFSGLSDKEKMVLLSQKDQDGYTPLYVLFRFNKNPYTIKNPDAIKAGLLAFSGWYEYNSYKRFTKALPYLFLGSVFLGLGLVSELYLKGMKVVTDNIKGWGIDLISGLLVALAIIALVYPTTRSFKVSAFKSALKNANSRKDIEDHLQTSGFTLKQNNI